MLAMRTSWVFLFLFRFIAFSAVDMDTQWVIGAVEGGHERLMDRFGGVTGNVLCCAWTIEIS